MKLYLMRHCLTDDGAQMDADRPLDDVGRQQAKVMRKFLKLADVQPDVIIASPFLRTQQTAEAMQRKQTPVKLSAALEPDSTPTKALAAILKIADGAKTVLVVTHGPLIQLILAAVAFNFVDEKWNFEHGSIAYVNTDDSRFRWFVTPKLAAHLVGKNPKKVEAAEVRLQLAAGMLVLAEHLLKVEKASVLDPLIARFRKTLKVRWSKQRARVVKAVRDTAKLKTGPLDVPTVKQFATNALGGADGKFINRAAKIRGVAYDLGGSHVALSLYRTIEAKKKTDDLLLPGLAAAYLADLEAQLDSTSATRIETAIDSLGENPTLEAVVQAVNAEFNAWSAAPSEQVARAETVALDAISRAYHDGGADLARMHAAITGADVEKHWDPQPDACEICLGNEADDWLPEAAPFDSGDFIPPAHPNCRCGLSYRESME